MRREIAVAFLAVVAFACEPEVEPLTPVGEARIDCQGVPPQHCQTALDDARAGSTSPLVELIVRCAAPPCTLQQGQIDVQARYADGGQSRSTSGWGVAAPAPGVQEPPVILPVEPMCLAVPDTTCLELATSAMSGLPRGGPAVASITVRCTATCTPTNGEGDTVVRFADGTSITSGWGYSSGGG
jgi:hypothetical protein